jgi:hypothetical protein
MMIGVVFAVATVIEPGGGSTFLGWTQDGQYLAWQTSDSSSHIEQIPWLDGTPVEDINKLSAADRKRVEYMDPPMMGNVDATIDETAQLAVVHDVRRNTDEKFMLDYKAVSKDGKTKGALKKKYASLPNAAAFAAWKKAHALVKKSGKASGAAKLTLEVTLTGTDPDDKPAWQGDTLGWSVMNQATVKLATACGKDTQADSFEQNMGAMYSPSWSATPFWEPTGHRVVVVMEEAVAKTMRGPDGGRLQYVIMPCGVRVDVVAPKGMEQATGPIADLVDKAGFTASIGVAKAHRAATVIYADAAHTELAKKLAAAIPGGATVDKLDWKPNAEIVVALGDSVK